MLNLKLNLNCFFLVSLIGYFFFNQLIKSNYLEFFFFIYLVIFFFIKVKNKIIFNYNKVIFILPLIVFCITILIFYFKDGNLFDLKIFVYLSIIILGYILFDFKKKDLEFFILSLIYVSILLILYGFYGWFNGGQDSNWGKDYIYFGYNYLPSSRNEDVFVFLVGYFLTLYNFFFKKDNKWMFVFNQLNLLAIILSFSRGAYLTLIFAFLIFIIINKNNIKINSIIKYFFSSIFIILLLFNLTNKTTKVDLNKYLKIKIKSIHNFIKNNNENKLNLKFSELENHYQFNNDNTFGGTLRNYKAVEKTSLYSLQLKINDWKNLFTDNKKTKKYYESSLIHIYKNYSLFSFLLILIFLFFLSFVLLVNRRLRQTYIENLTLNILFILLFLNLIYNYLDDYLNYIVLFFILSSIILKKNSSKKVGSFYKKRV